MDCETPTIEGATYMKLVLGRIPFILEQDNVKLNFVPSLCGVDSLVSSMTLLSATMYSAIVTIGRAIVWGRMLPLECLDGGCTV
jgi:hypothetical protein